MVNPTVTHPKRNASFTLPVRAGSGSGSSEQRVVIVELQDERDFAGELGGSRLQEAQRRRVGVTSGSAAQREMVARIISGGIGREPPRRAMLKAPVHRQDDEHTRADQRP